MLIKTMTSSRMILLLIRGKEERMVMVKGVGDSPSRVCTN